MGKAQQKVPQKATIRKALAAVANDADAEGHDIHHVTVRLLGNGEVTYRLHTREDNVPLGGIVTVAE